MGIPRSSRHTFHDGEPVELEVQPGRRTELRPIIILLGKQFPPRVLLPVLLLSDWLRVVHVCLLGRPRLRAPLIHSSLLKNKETLYLLRLCSVVQICLRRLTNGRTMKKAFGFMPILAFEALSFLLVGRSETANQLQDLISHRVFGQNCVDNGTFFIMYSLTSCSFITASRYSSGLMWPLMSKPVSSRTSRTAQWAGSSSSFTLPFGKPQEDFAQ